MFWDQASSRRVCPPAERIAPARKIASVGAFPVPECDHAGFSGQIGALSAALAFAITKQPGIVLAGPFPQRQPG